MIDRALVPKNPFFHRGVTNEIDYGIDLAPRPVHKKQIVPTIEEINLLHVSTPVFLSKSKFQPLTKDEIGCLNTITDTEIKDWRGDQAIASSEFKTALVALAADIETSSPDTKMEGEKLYKALKIIRETLFPEKESEQGFRTNNFIRALIYIGNNIGKFVHDASIDPILNEINKSLKLIINGSREHHSSGT